MIKKFLFLLVLTAIFCFNSYSQKEVKNLNGDIIQKGGKKNIYNKKIIVYKEITATNKDKILLLNKYIDTTKEIMMKVGFGCPTTLKQIKIGFQCLGGMANFVSLKLNHHQLLLSVKIYNMDNTFVAEVKDNKLVTAGKKYTEYASDKFIEIYNDYHIPVFQIFLDKKSNSITIKGVFFQRDGYEILSDASIQFMNYTKPYLYLTQSERDRYLDECIQLCQKYLRPIKE